MGEPGSGKTVLAIELVIRLLERREQDHHGPVPVLLSAAAYDSDRPWEEWLAGHLAKRFNTSAAAMANLIRDRRIVPLVDGLDEMDPSGQSQRARRVVVALNSFMQGRERAAVVVTSRRAEYDALGLGLDRATNIEMVPMTGSEAADYLTAQLRDLGERQEWQPLLAELAANPCGLSASQLSTPWRLMLALTVFRAGGHPADLLPDPSIDPHDAHALAGHARDIDALLLSRYVDSALRLRDPRGRYAGKPVHRWLTALAAGLARQSSHGLSAADIVLAQWWRTESTSFAAAMNIVLAAIPGIVLLSLSSGTGNNELQIISGAAIVMALLAALPPSPKRSRFRQLATRAGLARAAIGSASVVAFWLLAGLTLGLISGTLKTSAAIFLSFGLDIGIPVGLVAGLNAGLIDSSPHVIRPRDVIHADGLFGLASGLAVGLGAGLPFGLAFWFQGHQPAAALMAGLEAGLVFGLTMMIAVGASSWVRYHIAVLLAAIRGRGPLRFGAMLDWARDAGILRESGIAYQFRHRELQDWLAPPQALPAVPDVMTGAAVAGAVAALLGGACGIAAQFMTPSYPLSWLYNWCLLAGYALSFVTAILTLTRIKRPCIIGFLQGMWWPTATLVVSDIDQFTFDPSFYDHAVSFQLVGDLLGIIGVVLLTASLQPTASERRQPRIRLLPALLLGAVGLSQASRLLAFAYSARQTPFAAIALNSYYPIQGYVFDTLGIFLGLAVTWYSMTLKSRSLGCGIILGWTIAEFLGSVPKSSWWSPGAVGARFVDASEYIFLAIVLALTIIYARGSSDTGTSPVTVRSPASSRAA